MKMSPRSQRLSGIIQQQIPPLIEKYLTPNQLGFLTVSAIEISGDLGVADVFVSTIGGPKDWFRSLRKITKKIEHDIGQTNSFRRKMIIRFKEDQAPAHVKKIRGKFDTLSD